MGVRVYIAAAIIICILAGGIFALWRVDALFEEVAHAVRAAQAEPDQQQSRRLLQGAYDQVTDRMALLASLIPHDQMRTLCLAFERALAFSQSETRGEYDACLYEILFLSDAIRRFDYPSLISIL